MMKFDEVMAMVEKFENIGMFSFRDEITCENFMPFLPIFVECKPIEGIQNMNATISVSSCVKLAKELDKVATHKTIQLANEMNGNAVQMIYEIPTDRSTATIRLILD